MLSFYLPFYFMCEKVKPHALMFLFLHCTYCSIRTINSSERDIVYNVGSVFTMDAMSVLSPHRRTEAGSGIFSPSWDLFFFKLYTVVR